MGFGPFSLVLVRGALNLESSVGPDHFEASNHIGMKDEHQLCFFSKVEWISFLC